MFDTIAQLGTAAERTMSAIYGQLAQQFPEDGAGRTTLLTMCEEERAHGEAMEIIREALVSEKIEESGALGLVLEEQAGFLAEATDILLEVMDDPADLDPLIARLVVLESTLGDQLLPRLLPLLPMEHRGAVEGLVAQTGNHAAMLRGLR